MDLLTLAERTGIAPRRLRYAIYHTLMPGVRSVERGKGAVRHFTDFEAFGVALAATLLDAGLKRDVASDCIDAVVRRYGREATQQEVPLYRAFVARGSALLEVGDGNVVRVCVAASAGSPPFDTGWMPMAGRRHAVVAAATEPYVPVVLLSVNLAPLRRAIEQVSHAG